MLLERSPGAALLPLWRRSGAALVLPYAALALLRRGSGAVFALFWRCSGAALRMFCLLSDSGNGPKRDVLL